jgi:hypothetical protein
MMEEGTRGARHRNLAITITSSESRTVCEIGTFHHSCWQARWLCRGQNDTQGKRHAGRANKGMGRGEGTRKHRTSDKNRIDTITQNQTRTGWNMRNGNFIITVCL